MLLCAYRYRVKKRAPKLSFCGAYGGQYFAALFQGKWYNIKQLIGMAKESKLKYSTPIKYQIEISNKYKRVVREMLHCA